MLLKFLNGGMGCSSMELTGEQEDILLDRSLIHECAICEVYHEHPDVEAQDILDALDITREELGQEE